MKRHMTNESNEQNQVKPPIRAESDGIDLIQ